MPPAGFQPATPASDRPQTKALDRAATEIVLTIIASNLNCFYTKQYFCYFTVLTLILPFLEAALSKVWVSGHSLAGIAGSIPSGDMDVCLLRVLFVVSWRSLQRADTRSREVLPSVCVCVSHRL